MLCVAGPRGILLIGGKGYTHRVQAFHELAVRAQYVEYLHADAGHDVHVRDDVRRVADLHTDFRYRRSNRAHGVWNDVHRPAMHRPREKVGEPLPHLHGVFPVVRWTGFFTCRRTYVGLVFNAGNVHCGRADEDAVGPFLGV